MPIAIGIRADDEDRLKLDRLQSEAHNTVKNLETVERPVWARNLDILVLRSSFRSNSGIHH